MKKIHEHHVRIYYRDTDAGGVVYHGTYVALYAQARSEWLRDEGYQIGELHNQGILFPVRRIAIEYYKPLFLDDEIIVRSTLAHTRKVRLDFEQQIVRVAEPQVVVSEAQVQVALVDHNMKPLKLSTYLSKIVS